MLLLLVGGCGSDQQDASKQAMPSAQPDTETVRRPVRAPVITPRDDPAMANRPLVEPSVPTADDEPLTASAAETAADPDRFRIDKENDRLYLPGSGWMSIDSFWELYLNQPERLPPDLDHRLLEPIRPR